MRIEQLSYLHSLQETRSFSKTAEKFYTSHQVVSNAINNLEKEFSVTLLLRSFKGVEFTEAGNLVVEFADEVLKKERSLYQRLLPFQNQLHLKHSGTIMLHVIPRMINDWFLDFFNHFQKSNPDINLLLKNQLFSKIVDETVFDDTSMALVAIAEETLQMGQFQVQLEARNLTYTIISAQPLVFCADKNTDWAKLKGIDVNMRAEIPLIMFNYTAPLAPELSHRTDNSYYIDNFEAQKKLIKLGYGLGSYTLQEYNYIFKKEQNFVIIPSDVELLFYYILITAKGETLQPQLLYFIDRLKQWMS